MGLTKPKVGKIKSSRYYRAKVFAPANPLKKGGSITVIDDGGYLSQRTAARQAKRGETTISGKKALSLKKKARSGRVAHPRFKSAAFKIARR